MNKLNNKNNVFLSKSSPIKFFITNGNKKEKNNILINDDRDINLVNFLLKKNIVKTNNILIKNIDEIKNDTYNIIIWEPLNEKKYNEIIDMNNTIYNKSLMLFYNHLSDKNNARKYIDSIWIKEIKNKNLDEFENLWLFLKNTNNFSFPYVLKTFNWKWWKWTFIIKNTNDLENIKKIFNKKVVWDKSESTWNNWKIILDKYIKNKVDLNINVSFFENSWKLNYKILWVTQQITEWTLYRWNSSINKTIPWLYWVINDISKKLLQDWYKWNIWIDLMLDNKWNLYFNEFNTRYNSSTIFNKYINDNNFCNSEILLFESRTWKIDLENLKSFLLKDWIKWKVLPYEINWDKWTILLLLKWASNNRFLNKEIKLQNSEKDEIKEKNILMKEIRNNGFFEVRYNLFSKTEESSQKYYEQKEINNQHEKTPLIVFTWPRWVWKNYFSEKILSLYGDSIDFIPQISSREKRYDDNEKYIKTITKKEFKELKNEMFVFTWKYWILKKDIEKSILLWKIPILILWWKEIIKLKKKSDENILVFNITYPINNKWDLDYKVIEKIKKKRFTWRWWNQKIKNDNIITIQKYMNLFFNHPIFKKLFFENHITTINSDEDFIWLLWKVIKNTTKKNKNDK